MEVDGPLYIENAIIVFLGPFEDGTQPGLAPVTRGGLIIRFSLPRFGDSQVGK